MNNSLPWGTQSTAAADAAIELEAPPAPPELEPQPKKPAVGDDDPAAVEAEHQQAVAAWEARREAHELAVAQHAAALEQRDAALAAAEALRSTLGADRAVRVSVSGMARANHELGVDDPTGVRQEPSEHITVQVAVLPRPVEDA